MLLHRTKYLQLVNPLNSSTKTLTACLSASSLLLSLQAFAQGGEAAIDPVPEAPVFSLPNAVDSVSQPTLSETLAAGETCSGCVVSGEISNFGALSAAKIAPNAVITNSGSIDGVTLQQGAKIIGSETAGIISNAVLSEMSVIQDSALSGEINSRGELKRVTLASGTHLTGGLLSQTIVNNGVVENVLLTRAARLVGGVATGNIIGSDDTKLDRLPVLDGVTLKPPAYVNNVAIESCSAAPSGVTFGPRIDWRACKDPVVTATNVSAKKTDVKSINADTLFGEIKLTQGNESGVNQFWGGSYSAPDSTSAMPAYPLVLLSDTSISNTVIAPDLTGGEATGVGNSMETQPVTLLMNPPGDSDTYHLVPEEDRIEHTSNLESQRDASNIVTTLVKEITTQVATSPFESVVNLDQLANQNAQQSLLGSLNIVSELDGYKQAVINQPVIRTIKSDVQNERQFVNELASIAAESNAEVTYAENSNGTITVEYTANGETTSYYLRPSLLRAQLPASDTGKCPGLRTYPPIIRGTEPRMAMCSIGWDGKKSLQGLSPEVQDPEKFVKVVEELSNSGEIGKVDEMLKLPSGEILGLFDNKVTGLMVPSYMKIIEYEPLDIDKTPRAVSNQLIDVLTLIEETRELSTKVIKLD